MASHFHMSGHSTVVAIDHLGTCATIIDVLARKRAENALTQVVLGLLALVIGGGADGCES